MESALPACAKFEKSSAPRGSHQSCSLRSINALVSSGIKYGVVDTAGFHPVGPGATPYDSVASDGWGIKGELFNMISQRP